MEVDMTGIELFDSHDLFMEVVIWQSMYNGFFSFIVTDMNKGGAWLETTDDDLYQRAYGTKFIKNKDDYRRCYIVKRRYI